jgi:hypothetical protein
VTSYVGQDQHGEYGSRNAKLTPGRKYHPAMDSKFDDMIDLSRGAALKFREASNE